jgi:hypothetical protein
VSPQFRCIHSVVIRHPAVCVEGDRFSLPSKPSVKLSCACKSHSGQRRVGAGFTKIPDDSVLEPDCIFLCVNSDFQPEPTAPWQSRALAIVDSRVSYPLIRVVKVYRFGHTAPEPLQYSLNWEHEQFREPASNRVGSRNGTSKCLHFTETVVSPLIQFLF